MVRNLVGESLQIELALRDPMDVLVGCAVLSGAAYCTLTDTP